jgi:ligand-binding sensor domain-containing protein
MSSVESLQIQNVIRVAMWMLVAAAIEVHAEQLPIKTYTTADGLAHNRVKRVVQDSHGFLWFCAASGLSRFDGYRLSTIRLRKGCLLRQSTTSWTLFNRQFLREVGLTARLTPELYCYRRDCSYYERLNRFAEFKDKQKRLIAQTISH